MSKLYFPDQASAQVKADAIHQAMIASDPNYASSVAAGQTLHWDIPKKDLDDKGVPLSTQWYVTVLDRCQPVLSTADIAAAGLPALATSALKAAP